MIISKIDGKCNICGQRIREIQEKQQITQTQLASRCQVQGLSLNQNSVSRIETGKRIVSDFELVAIAKALRVRTFSGYS